MKGLLAAAVVVTALSLTACGIPAESEPIAIKADDLPTALQRPEPRPEDDKGGIIVYYINPELSVQGCLEQSGTGAESNVEGSDAKKSETWLTALLKTDTPTQLQNFATGFDLEGVSEDAKNILVINLSEEFLDIEGEQQTKAVAQMVYTATQPLSAQGQRQVRFMAADENLTVPKGKGEDGAVVSRGDYLTFSDACPF